MLPPSLRFFQSKGSVCPRQVRLSEVGPLAPAGLGAFQGGAPVCLAP